MILETVLSSESKGSSYEVDGTPFPESLINDALEKWCKFRIPQMTPHIKTGRILIFILPTETSVRDSIEQL